MSRGLTLEGLAASERSKRKRHNGHAPDEGFRRDPLPEHARRRQREAEESRQAVLFEDPPR